MTPFNNLQKLNYNQLTSHPDLPPTLQYLDCSENKLTSLPLLPTSLKSLRIDYSFQPYGYPITLENLKRYNEDKQQEIDSKAMRNPVFK